MNNLKNIIIAIIGLLASKLLASDYYASLDNVSLASLGQIKVYTAQREEVALNDSLSTVSVITAKEIKEQGIITLAGVLERVPGMFLAYDNEKQDFVVARGITQDQNTGILILIDGVVQNSNAYDGFDSMHLFPLLFNVKQIEIVRGSSSTLWGDTAALAVINIITYSGSDLDKNQEGTFYTGYKQGLEAPFSSLDLMYAKSFDNADVMLSYNYTESKKDMRSLNYEGDKVFYDAWDTIRPSHNLYLNASFYDFKLNARYAYMQNPKTQNYSTLVSEPLETDSDVVIKRAREIYTVDLKYSTDITDAISIDSQLGYLRQKLINGPENSPVQNEVSFDERTFFLEMILRYKTDSFDSLLGVKLKDIDYQLLYLPQEKKSEQTKAVFFQTTYNGIEDLAITAGARYASSNSGIDEDVFMPSFSALYKIQKELSLRYSYSTGFIAPLYEYNLHITRDRTHLTPPKITDIKGTDVPNEVKTHEISILYANDTFKTTTTFFHVDSYNQFNWIGSETAGEDIGGLIYNDYYFYGNIDHIQTQGIEFELIYMINSRYNIYTNITYQDSKYKSPYITTDRGAIQQAPYTDGAEIENVPDYLYNLGLNADLYKTLTMNLHLRGDEGIKSGDRKTGIQNYVDVNFRYRDFIFKELDFALYGKNIFDNTKNNDDGYYGQVESRATFGLSIEYQF